MQRIRAELISVGTEIIIGDIVDTHSQFLSQLLARYGVSVLYHTSVGDNAQRLEGVVTQALSRSDLIVVTGGLGPTADDMSKEIVAKAMGLELEMRPEILENIRTYFKRVCRDMTHNNEKQALIPKGAVAIENRHGTAPGILIEEQGKTVILLPGPPRELYPMAEEFLTEYLKNKYNKIIYSNNLRIMGIGESKIEQMLGTMMDSANPTVALYAKTSEVLLRVTSSADTRDQAQAQNQQMIDKIKAILGDAIYGIDVDNLQQVVVQALLQRGQKIATAESCTGGMISSMLTEVPGASQVFDCGVCSYANRIKSDLLGVPKKILEQYGAVSEQTAILMAQGVQALSGADYGLSVTGIAGPDGGTEQKPVGTVFIGLATPTDSKVKKLQLRRSGKDSREMIRKLAAAHALKFVLDTLMQSQ